MIDLDSKADHQLGGVNCALTANLWPAFVKKIASRASSMALLGVRILGRGSGTKLCLCDHSLAKKGKFFAGPSVVAAIDSDICGLNKGMELARALISGTEIGPD